MCSHRLNNLRWQYLNVWRGPTRGGILLFHVLLNRTRGPRWVLVSPFGAGCCSTGSSPGKPCRRRRLWCPRPGGRSPRRCSGWRSGRCPRSWTRDKAGEPPESSRWSATRPFWRTDSRSRWCSVGRNEDDMKPFIFSHRGNQNQIQIQGSSTCRPVGSQDTFCEIS